MTTLQSSASITHSFSTPPKMQSTHQTPCVARFRASLQPQLRFSLLFFVAALGLGFTPVPANGANILFYFGMSGHSHLSSIWPVLEALGARGHLITVLTSIPPKSKHPAVSVVHVPEMFDLFKDLWDEGGDLIEDRLHGRRIDPDQAIPSGLEICRTFFTAPSTQRLLHNTSFDLVVMDNGLNECVVGLATLHYKSPLMAYNAMPTLPGTQDDYGIPVESWLPEIEYGQPVRTFRDRLWATYQDLRWIWIRRVRYYPKLAEIFVEHLKLTETPDIIDLQKKTSIVLMNGHYAHTYAMSLPPMFVSIAGIGMQEQRKELPKTLADFIARGKEGFIYISFGTQVLIHKSKPELRAKFFNAFGRFPNLRFVWKWEGEEKPAEAPSNIYFSKWVPQQDLLAHPSVKGYIAHGGMNGLNEGVNYGVPMIVFPIFGDQDFNANAVGSKGLAILMELADFTEQDLVDKINLALHDEAFKSRVKRASEVFNDRPMKPVDTAIWWIEYVLRYKGDTPFLMPDGVHQTWWQRRLLDVWFFVFTVLLASLTLVLYVTWKIGAWLLCFGTSSSSSSRSDINHNKLKSS